MQIFDKLIIISFIVFAISFICFWILGFAAKISGEVRDIEDALDLFKNKFVKITTLTALFSGILTFVGSFALEKILESNIKEDLRTFNKKRDRLFINGFQPSNAKNILNELISYSSIRTNHSVPLKRLKIKVYLNGKIINLEFARDSQDSTVYWVFVPDYNYSRDNEIWKGRTNLLNQYK